MSAFKRDLVTSKHLALSTVRLQPGSFQRPQSQTLTRTNARERRLTVTFPGTANQPIVIFHGLGVPPSGFTPLSHGSGIVYNDTPLPATSRVIVLKSNTANLVADILVR